MTALTDIHPTCERCRHWREITDASDKTRYGECRRYPPTPFLNDEGMQSLLPYTEPSDTCGEFRAGQ
jgi:hypothetical protein